MFARTPRNSFGNAGVGILRLPATNNWDMSLYRRIPFNEHGIFRNYPELDVEPA